MILHTFETKQFINSDINSIWNFISSPDNLKLITPCIHEFHRDR